MAGRQDAEYRLRVADGFLAESRQDVSLRRWRSAVDNAQLAVENSAKAVLALVGPVGRTHNPAVQLRGALNEGLFAASDRGQVSVLPNTPKHWALMSTFRRTTAMRWRLARRGTSSTTRMRARQWGLPKPPWSWRGRSSAPLHDRADGAHEID